MASKANKNVSGLVATKNASSVRKVQLNWQLTVQLATLLIRLPKLEPVFSGEASPKRRRTRDFDTQTAAYAHFSFY